MAKKVAKKKVVRKATTQSAGAKKSTTQSGAGGPARQTVAHAQDIWLAGLGAFALAQDEGGKILKEGARALEGTGRKVVGEGAKLFERLVKEGNKIQTVGKKMAEEAVDDVREDVTGRVTKVRKGAQANWDRFEKVFEERVAKALARLGVPTSDEIEALTQHVARLNAQVAQLNQGRTSTTRPKAASKKKAAKKKVAKKKVASKKATVKPATPKQS